uniref:Uncharacterized protein n=1 Tax=Candidatus Methanophaga sp. ANME-1 ERB7 TaxID=2759913 RepID=A0A7G9ZCD1_9EURY|nr:hypothetical protein GHLLLOKB_00003 [Methanosarcinales archaeon ANME-1 ERB7]
MSPASVIVTFTVCPAVNPVILNEKNPCGY